MLRRTMMLVEDNLLDVKAVKRAIHQTQLNCSVVHCTTGDEAWKYLRAAQGHGEERAEIWPDVILLDLNLPGLTGTELLQQIKEDQELCLIPVIVFSSSSNEVDITRSFNAGANSYITKPLIYKDLMRTIKHLSDFWFDTARLPVH